MKALLFAALLAVCSWGANAATVAERSPFAQGLWWDSTRAGNGFDLFNVGTDVSLLWYTYDALGAPIWYSAQGPLNGTSTATLALMEHRWANGAHASATAAGTIRLDVKNPERIEASWSVGGRSGTWTIAPFLISGTINEVDHTGTWFDPTRPGWGLSFIEQGDGNGGVLFTYDAAGKPTWLAGFGRDRGSVEMFTFTGACPGCASLPPTSRSVGRLGYDFEQEWRLALHDTMAANVAVQVEGAKVYQLGRPASTRGADRQLANFGDDAQLKTFLLGAYGNILYGAATGFSASPPGSGAGTFSTTNLQEAGVDEADVVKTDGNYAYTFVYENGVRKPVIRFVFTGGDGSTIQPRGGYALQSGSATPMQTAGLYLTSSALVSVTGTKPVNYFMPISPSILPGSWVGGTTAVEVMSMPLPTAPTTAWRAEIDGHLVASRRIGDRLYIVTRFVPYQTIPASSPTSLFLPGVKVNGGAAQPLLSPSQIYVPPQGERLPVLDVTTVTAIDLVQPRIAQSLAVIGTPETLYAAPQNLYVATTRSGYRLQSGALNSLEGFVTTDLHQIHLDANGMSIVGSGSIEGYLGSDPEKSAFRMGEYKGQLRIVSSASALWNGMKNKLTVLEPSPTRPGLLRTVSVLPNAQRPEPLGKPNEMLYATRFVDDRLYAVTFMSIDPLYVVDVSNGADPRIAGSLQVSGFSDYLHPLPNGLLLGFGKEACPVPSVGDGTFAWYQGLQLALFDVSDPSQPRYVQKAVIGKRGSTSALLGSHHAFSALTRPDGSMTLAIPARVTDGPPVSSCDSTQYPWKESGLLRFDVRGSGASAQLSQLPSLITHNASTFPSLGMNQDPAADGARSIIFPNATIYIGNGQFWRVDANGASGPF